MLSQSTSLLNARRSSLSSPLPAITTYPSLLSVLEEVPLILSFQSRKNPTSISSAWTVFSANFHRTRRESPPWPSLGVPFFLLSPLLRRASSPWRHAPRLRSRYALGVSFGTMRSIAGPANGGGIEASDGAGAVSALCGVSAAGQSEELVSVCAAVRAGADGGRGEGRGAW